MIGKEVIYMVKAGFIAGFVNLLFGLGINAVLGMILPGLEQEYQNSSVFRSWQDPLMMIYVAYPFILGLVLTYLWRKLYKQLKGTDPQKAMEFAKIYFVIATIPGMFISYTSLQLSFLMILVWTFTGFIQAYLAGLVYTKYLK